MGPDPACNIAFLRIRLCSIPNVPSSALWSATKCGILGSEPVLIEINSKAPIYFSGAGYDFRWVSNNYKRHLKIKDLFIAQGSKNVRFSSFIELWQIICVWFLHQ